MSDAPHEELAEWLAGVHRLLVLTGAGISTACGIPDYRGPDGRWKVQQPVEYGAFLASGAARRAYWDQKLEAWRRWGAARPSAAHRAIPRLLEAGRLELCVTQNIDGLHTRAGLPPERLVEVHGNQAEVECLACGDRRDAAPFYARYAETAEPPCCACGGFWKPATISFGQSLRADDLRRAFEAAGRADGVLALGSSLSVTPAADIPLRAAERGVPYAVVNRGVTAHDGLPGLSLRIEGDVEDVLPPAVDAVLGRAR